MWFLTCLVLIFAYYLFSYWCWVFRNVNKALEIVVGGLCGAAAAGSFDSSFLVVQVATES